MVTTLLLQIAALHSFMLHNILKQRVLHRALSPQSSFQWLLLCPQAIPQQLPSCLCAQTKPSPFQQFLSWRNKAGERISADRSKISDSYLLRKKNYYCLLLFFISCPLPICSIWLNGKQREEQKVFKLTIFQDPQKLLSTRSNGPMLKPFVCLF